MARKRINVKKIREIIRFRKAHDMSDRKIARVLNISRPVVAQYIKEFTATGLTYEDIKDMPDSQFLALFGYGVNYGVESALIMGSNPLLACFYRFSYFLHPP